MEGGREGRMEGWGWRGGNGWVGVGEGGVEGGAGEGAGHRGAYPQTGKRVPPSWRGTPSACKRLTDFLRDRAGPRLFKEPCSLLLMMNYGSFAAIFKYSSSIPEVFFPPSHLFSHKNEFLVW